jgi:hypothetical protein
MTQEAHSQESTTSDADNAALMQEIERSIPPMNIANAGRLLDEARDIFDSQGIVFFLRQGTCLGAVRDQALIPWDDDLDLGSIIGLHGFNEDYIAPAVEAFRAIGCYVEVIPEGLYTSVKIMKYRIRIDWQCYRVVKGTIAHYPGVPFPVELFTRLDQIEFNNGKYSVPSPPSEYLRYKYGPDWITPKQAGYEKDVLDAMPTGTVPGRAGWLRQWLTVFFSPLMGARSQTAQLLVLDANDNPVANAKVLIAGLCQTRTGRNGWVKFYLPGPDEYAFEITSNGHEEVLYEEALVAGKKYVYRPDPDKTAGRYFVLTET